MDLVPLHAAAADATSPGLPASAWAVFVGLLLLLGAAAVATWAYVRWRFPTRQEGNASS